MRETLHWLESRQKGSRAIGPKETPGVAVTCQDRGLASQHRGLSAHRQPRPSGAALKNVRRSLAFVPYRERALPARLAVARPPGVGHAPHPSDPFLGRKKRKDCSHGPSRMGGGWGGPHRSRPDTGLARTHRSGSGSPPQCCGRRTRTKAPPSSRQGTRRVSLTRRTTGVSVSGPGGGHTSGSDSVERA